MCPNIEVEIEVTDRSPLFIRPFHATEEDKTILNREMERLCYLGILKEGFSAYPSPVMLISRKLTKDKKSHDRFQAFKHENSQKQSSISFTEGHLHYARKFQMQGNVHIGSQRHISFS